MSRKLSAYYRVLVSQSSCFFIENQVTLLIWKSEKWQKGLKAYMWPSFMVLWFWDCLPIDLSSVTQYHTCSCQLSLFGTDSRLHFEARWLFYHGTIVSSRVWLSFGIQHFYLPIISTFSLQVLGISSLIIENILVSNWC